MRHGLLARTRRCLLVSSVAMALAGCVATDAGGPQAAGMVGAAVEAGGGEEWMLPSGDPSYLMRTRVYRPGGSGPFPMVVISHGSEQDPAARRRARRPDYPGLTRWFLERGYVVVVPERPGHAGGGDYLEDQGGCRDADYVKSADGAADSMAAAVDFMKRQPFVAPDGIIIAGHSAGGFGSLAYAARRPPGLRAVVNFSGGRGGRHMNQAGNNCAPERLVAAAAHFGSATRVPTLWIYAENDSYFPPDLSKAMAVAFTDAGGRADYLLLPPVAVDGHAAIGDVPAWSGGLREFLDGLR